MVINLKVGKINIKRAQNEWINTTYNCFETIHKSIHQCKRKHMVPGKQSGES